jgi:glucose/arabinose dehydrogenase
MEHFRSWSQQVLRKALGGIARRRFSLWAGTVASVLGAGTRALASFPPVALQPVTLGQLQAPVCIASAHDGSGRLFVCEQRGQVRIVQNGGLLPGPFLDVSAKIVALTASYDERGLLGLAFHPGYTNPASAGYRKFYVFYSAPSTNAPGTTTSPVNCRTTIAEYQVSTGNPNAADTNSARIVLAFDKPQGNHNGGQLELDAQGLLYIGTGDGGGGNDNNYGHTGGGANNPSGGLGNAQDKTKLLGKILRIDPLGTNGPGAQYGIPLSNPLVGQGGGVREEIYAFGLRNPWRFSFDDGPGGTGRLFAGDVGQNSIEEVDLITPGGNYGWRCKEGTNTFDGTAPNGGLPFIGPIAQYAHPGVTIGPPQLGTAVVGGYVYRGNAIAGLSGKYVFGDLSTNVTGAVGGLLLGLEEPTSNNWTLSVLTVKGGNPFATHVMSFGRDDQGELYVATEVVEGPQNDPATGLPTGGLYQVVSAQTTNVTFAALNMTNRQFRMNFLATVGTSWNVLAATNAAQLLSGWTLLGAATQVSPGQFQFTDTATTNSTCRFYRLRAF